jgi:hypothetical protein
MGPVGATEAPPADPEPAIDPETTASIDAGPSPIEEPAVLEPARLPRERPEPPATVGQQDTPTVVEEPGFVPADGMEVPVIGGPGPQGVPVVPFDPLNPPATLTPAEYQALLERRAWATEYAARRRAVAEGRTTGEHSPVVIGGPFQ